MADYDSCSCRFEPHTQTIPATRQTFVYQPDALAALLTGPPPALESDSDLLLATAFHLVNASPPIPARILYCSWLI